MFGRLSLILAVLLFNSPASSWPKHGGSVNTGFVNANIGAGEQIPANFINILKTGAISYSGGSSPGTAQPDVNGIPTASGWTGQSNISFPTGQQPGQYVATWKTGTKLQILNLGVNTGCSFTGTGGSVSGCVGGNMTLTIDGTGAGTMTWTPSVFSMAFVGSGSFGAAGTANFAIVSSNDIANYNTYSGTNDVRGTFTPSFVSYVKGLAPAPGGPKTIRPMGWTNRDDVGGNISTDVQWGYRTPVNSVSWVSPRLLLSTWSGGTSSAGAITHTTSGTCNGSATGELYTAQATIDTPSPSGTPAYGTVVQGVIDTTNSTTSPILCWGTTAFPIFSGQFATLPTVGGSQSIGTTGGTLANKTGAASFIFEPKLGSAGVWLYFRDGLTSTTPVEAQIILANGVNSSLWVNIPYLADNTYVINLLTAMLAANTWLPPRFEYSNEIWNNQFGQTKYAVAIGQKFGFPSGDSEDIYGWYGIRVRQIMGDIVPPIWAGRNYYRTMAYKASDPGFDTLTYRFEGADLAPSGTSTGKGNASYNAFTSSANYTTVGNRPIDKADRIAYAPYAGGANLMNGGDIFGGSVPNALNAPYYQSVVNAWEAGSTATAISLIDDDIRQGRTSVQTVLSCSGTTFTTGSAHGFVSGTSQVAFQVTGGTSYPGLVKGAMYLVSSTPLSTTFTIQGFVNGINSGANINCGSAGSGTVTVGWIGNGGTNPNFQTMQAVANNWFLSAQNLGATYSKGVEWYEGNLEPVGPTPTQCAGLGITTPTPITVSFTADTGTTTGLANISSVTGLFAGMVITGTNMASNAVISRIDPVAKAALLTPLPTGNGSGISLTATGNCGTDISSAIFAWKNDAMSTATQKTYFDQFMGQDANMVPTFGLMANSFTPAQLVITGAALDGNDAASNAYGLSSSNLTTVTPYKTYNGITTFVGKLNFLLKRDIYPASNDNDPMWLKKAA